LQETTSTLVNICDQNENQNLTETSSQMAFLDNYAGAADTATSTRELYKAWQQMLKRVDELEQTNQRETDRKELLNYQLNELRSLSLLENEFEQVENEHRRLSNSKELIDSTENVLEVISGLEELRQSNAKISGINDSSPHLDSAKENLSSALSLIDDAERDLKKYQDQVVVDPDRLDQLESRLSAILTTAKKHRIEPSEVHSYTQRLEDSLGSIKDLETELNQLKESSEELEQKFLEESRKLSKRRRQYSDQFAKT
jgi:ATPase involved in DNA repair